MLFWLSLLITYEQKANYEYKKRIVYLSVTMSIFVVAFIIYGLVGTMGIHRTSDAIKSFLFS